MSELQKVSFLGRARISGNKMLQKFHLNSDNLASEVYINVFVIVVNFIFANLYFIK